MKQEITKRLSIVIAVTMLFVLAINLFLQIESAGENMKQSAQMTIERIEAIIESNRGNGSDSTGAGHIFANLAVQDGFLAVAVDRASGTLAGATQPELVGREAASIGLVIPEKNADFFYARINDRQSCCVFREYGDLMIGVMWEEKVLYEDLTQSMLLVLLYLTVAALMMIAVILRSMDYLVIGSINTINENLAEITGGNLDTRVQVDTLPEFVDLSSHINQMTDSLLNTTVKISRILDATNAQIGFFEYNMESGGVLATRKVATILMIPPEEMKRLTSDKDLFRAKISEICEKPVDEDKMIYSLPTETACYVKLETFSEGNKIFGIVMDVTEEIIERERIRHERDHDLLTQLDSRRSFYRKLDELFAAPEKLGQSVMMMFDLDGLKTINDTCGHAGGDKAIREAANILGSINSENKVTARLSGDEFAVFLYGAKEREELQAHIDALYTTMRRGEVTVFDKTVAVRLSGGYVFYPEHKAEYADLLRMADLALYHSKRMGKAQFSAYSSEFADEEK